jgi:hypothetical protein
VVRTDAAFGGMTTVFFTGGVVKAETTGQGAKSQQKQEQEDDVGPQGRHWHVLPSLLNGTSESELSAWCTAEMQAYRFSTPTETTCGRPLGMRYVPVGTGGRGLLYIADAYHGLFTLHTGDLTVKHLVPSEAPTTTTTTIPGGDAMHPGVSKPLRFSNDMDIMPDGSGDVFFTDSTWAWSRAEHAVEIVDGAPRGRLLRYDGASGGVEPVICGLHFANGVQLLGQGSSVLVVESTRFRILKVDLDAWRRSAPHERLAALRACDEDAPRPPFVRTFVEGLPGLPDNLRLHEGAATGPMKEGGFLLLGMGAKNTQPFALLQFLYQHRLLRLVLGALVPLKHFHTLVPKYGLAGILTQVRACWRAYLPCGFFSPCVDWEWVISPSRPFPSIHPSIRSSPLAQPQDGELLRLLQDPTGRTPFVSEVHVHPQTGDLLLGSFRNRFLGRVTLSSL